MRQNRGASKRKKENVERQKKQPGKSKKDWQHFKQLRRNGKEKRLKLLPSKKKLRLKNKETFLRSKNSKSKKLLPTNQLFQVAKISVFLINRCLTFNHRDKWLTKTSKKFFVSISTKPGST